MTNEIIGNENQVKSFIFNTFFMSKLIKNNQMTELF